MQFKGQLLLPDDSGPGLRVSLDVAAHHLAVESDDGGLGAWPLEVVDVERNGDVFSLTVAGELLQFLADDTIAFAYSGIPTIESVSGRRSRSKSGFRSMLDRIWNGPQATHGTTAVEPAADEIDAPAETESDPVLDTATAESLAVVEIPVEIPVETLPAIEAEEARDLSELASEPGCPAVRSDGRRCESPILTSSGYCYPHDPKRAFEDKYQSAQEARAKLKRDATARLNRIYSRLDKAMRQVESGDLDPETAMAMAQVARTMCAILDIDEPVSGERR